MTIETLPQQPFGHPTSHAVGRFRDLWAWLRRDHGIWTDILYGAIPLVPMVILLAIPGNTLIKAMAEYAFLVLVIFLSLFVHGAWRQLCAWHQKRVAKR